MLSKIKLDYISSEASKLLISKKDPSLKDYLMAHHWFLNHSDNNKNTNDHNNSNKLNNLLSFSTKQQENQNNYARDKSFQPDKQYRLSTKETPTQSLKETQKSTLKQIPQTSVRNISQDNLDSPGMNTNYSPTKMLSKHKRISFETNTIHSAIKNQTHYANSKSSSDEVAANHATSFHFPDKHTTTLQQYSVFNSKAETLYGWSIDETTHKKNYYKIKVSPIHAGYSYLGVTLENQTEKRSNTEQRILYKTQSNLLADSLVSNKIQAIEAIKLQRRGTSPPQMIPLLQLVNSVDFLQDSLLLKGGKDLGFISKSTFSLKNLLEEIQTVFKMTGSIEELVNTPTKTCKVGFFNEIPQRKSISGKPPKDSLFAPQRKTAVILDTSPLLPTPSPLRKTLSTNMDAFSNKTTNFIGKLTPVDLSTSCVLTDDAFSIFNDKYRIKQVLIALALNMRCWHRALNNPISQENENNNNSNQKPLNDMELSCTEERNQFCEFFTVNFKLQVKDFQLQCISQEMLLKYLNGVNNPQINKSYLLSLQSYVKMIGPYKLKTEIIDNKCISISFDIFKNVDIMDIPEKNQLNESLQSQSMIFQTSMNNFNNNYQRGTNALQRSLYLQQSQKLQGKSLKQQRSKKLDRSVRLGTDYYGQQSALGFENQSESVISQGNEASSIIGDPQMNQIQLVRGDIGGTKGDKINVSSHNVLNKEFKKTNITCQPSQDIEQSQDLTLKLPDLNSAIKNIFHQVGISPRDQENLPRILELGMIQKSRINQDKVEDSVLSQSKSCSLGESNVQTNLTQIQAIPNIHTINSITNHLK